MSGTITMEDPHKVYGSENQPLNSSPSYNPSGLHVKLQKQRNKMRNSSSVKSAPITSAPKKSSLISASRLQIPKLGGYHKLESSPLVTLESDSEDEIFLTYNKQNNSARQINEQLTLQLQKDGFQLDEMPDDEALDLIPPSDFRRPEYCQCCGIGNSCAIS